MYFLTKYSIHIEYFKHAAHSEQICEVIQQNGDTHASTGISAHFATNIRKTELELSKFYHQYSVKL
jgi:hypothetical protein